MGKETHSTGFATVRGDAMKETSRWFVYILECDNGSYYTGSTDDMARRYGEHRKGTAKSKYTRSFRPVRIAGCWTLTGSRGDAMRVERFIQGLNRKEKNTLVADPGTLRAMVLGAYENDFSISPAAPEEIVPEDDHDITGYSARDREWSIANPYLEEVLSLVSSHRSSPRDELLKVMSRARPDYVSRYAFSIPTIEVIEEIAASSPLIEIGAGGGYWARCLRDAGADIIAYDKRPPGEEDPWDWRSGNQWFDDTWLNVQEGDEAMAGRYPERTLLLCWPPIHDPMALNALRRYRKAGGTRMIFIGARGSSADDAFFRELDRMKLVCAVRLWSWPGIDDWMRIYDLTP